MRVLLITCLFGCKQRRFRVFKLRQLASVFIRRSLSSKSLLDYIKKIKFKKMLERLFVVFILLGPLFNVQTFGFYSN